MNSMELRDLLILSLATWRLSYMIVKEPGPFELLARFRARFRFKLFTCIFCLSVYMALFLWLLTFTWLWFIVYGLAISGAALMLHRYTGFHVE